MPEVLPHLFPISLATAPDMLQHMLEDLPNRLQPYANPGAESAIIVHESHSADAASMVVRNEPDVRTYCLGLLATVAHVIRSLSPAKSLTRRAEEYDRLVNVYMDYFLGINGEAKIGMEVKTDLVFITFEPGIDELVGVPWLGLTNAAARNFEGAQAMLMKVSASSTSCYMLKVALSNAGLELG
jgi:hypothetical protein